MLDQLLDRLSRLTLVAEERVEHLLESPLCPLVVVRCASTHFSVPIKAEANLVQLLTIAVNVLESGFLRVLTCLDGILLSRQSIGIITHRVQYVEALQTLEASIDVARNIS